MAVADAVCRLVPGVLSDPSCYENESHWNGMLEAPQYSRPEVWHGRAVPPILLSGNHAKVDRWRRKMSILRTRQRRPDLYEKLDLSSKEDQKLLKELEADYARLEELISAINRTNNATKVEGGTTLSDLLARRDCLKGKLSVLRGFLDNASALVRRHSVSEIKIKSTVDVRRLQKQVDGLSKELRQLEEVIQEKNWTTELL